jgi:hypothetical protein
MLNYLWTSSKKTLLKICFSVKFRFSSHSVLKHEHLFSESFLIKKINLKIKLVCLNFLLVVWDLNWIGKVSFDIDLNLEKTLEIKESFCIQNQIFNNQKSNIPKVISQKIEHLKTALKSVILYFEKQTLLNNNNNKYYNQFTIFYIIFWFINMPSFNARCIYVLKRKNINCQLNAEKSIPRLIEKLFPKN